MQLIFLCVSKSRGLTVSCLPLPKRLTDFHCLFTLEGTLFRNSTTDTKHQVYQTAVEYRVPTLVRSHFGDCGSPTLSGNIAFPLPCQDYQIKGNGGKLNKEEGTCLIQENIHIGNISWTSSPLSDKSKKINGKTDIYVSQNIKLLQLENSAKYHGISAKYSKPRRFIQITN